MECAVDAASFNADPAGEKPNTRAIQDAIDACHRAGGGRVRLGPGRYLTGALELRSHVELHLAPGCRLVGSPCLADYAPLAAEGFHADQAPEGSSHSLLRAVDADNVAITGTGTIDGSGLAFYDAARAEGKLDKPRTPRPRLGMFYRCRDLRIQDVAFVDSACWTLWLMQCDGVHLHRVSISGNRRLRNVDGVDVDACRNVTISDCRIDTEDDCIVLRAIQRVYADPALCENVTVTNCVLNSSCQAVRVGCPGDGTIRRGAFSNLVIRSDHNGILFENPHRYLPAGSAGSARISDILFSNVVMDCRHAPIRIVVEDGIALPQLSDLSFSDFRIRSGEPCVVQGCPETIIRNVRFANMRIDTRGGDAILCRHCAGVQLSQVELSNRAGEDCP